MSALALLPMYDWPEERAHVDATYATLRRSVPELPATLTRPQSDAEMAALWRDPSLLLAQTCWGPMRAGLAAHVQVLAQPLYDAFLGGAGTGYRSALIARTGTPCPVPASAGADLPDDLRQRRIAINLPQSLSGCLALQEDACLPDLAQVAQVTGSHRASVRAVAQGLADVAAIDCRSWALALAHEPAAQDLRVIGWTALRPGLPYVTAQATPLALQHKLAKALARIGAQPNPDLQELP